MASSSGPRLGGGSGFGKAPLDPPHPASRRQRDHREPTNRKTANPIRLGEHEQSLVGDHRVHRRGGMDGVEEEEAVGDGALRIEGAGQIDETGNREVGVVTGDVDRRRNDPEGGRVGEEVFDEPLDIEFEEGRDGLGPECGCESTVEVEAQSRDGVALGGREHRSAARREREVAIGAADVGQVRDQEVLGAHPLEIANPADDVVDGVLRGGG
jgi:hypothetical protein